VFRVFATFVRAATLRKRVAKVGAATGLNNIPSKRERNGWSAEGGKRQMENGRDGLHED